MNTVKLTILSSQCRSGYHRAGDEFTVDDICPPLCHELWHAIYPNICVLQNGGVLDYGEGKEKCFEVLCPDQGRVMIRGEIL